MSNLSIRYNLVLKRSEQRKLLLPDLKSSCLILQSFEIKSDQKAFDLKLVGKDTILSYGEAVFYQSSSFDLRDKLAQIIDATQINVTIKNLCTVKDANAVNLTLIFNYVKLEGNVIYNNIYANLNEEGLQTILADIISAGKHITKIMWTSANKLTSIELVPQFETEPGWLSTIKELADGQNRVIFDLTDEKYDLDITNQLRYYKLVVPDNLERLGVIVYGYIN